MRRSSSVKRWGIDRWAGQGFWPLASECRLYRLSRRRRRQSIVSLRVQARNYDCAGTGNLLCIVGPHAAYFCRLYRALNLQVMTRISAFRDARSKGAGHELYDFGNCAAKPLEHPWQNFSEFQLTVDGKEVRLATNRDLVFDLRLMIGSG